MKNRIKITISYLEDDQLNRIVQALKPILNGANVRKTNNYEPYKHAYITIKNDDNTHKLRD